MKPRMIYVLHWDDGAQVTHHRLDVTERVIAANPKRIAKVTVATANRVLSVERSEGWGSGSRAVAAEHLRGMRARLIERAQERWG